MHFRFLLSVILVSTVCVGCSRSGTERSKSPSSNATSEPADVGGQAGGNMKEPAESDGAASDVAADEGTADDSSDIGETAPVAAATASPAKPVRKISADAFRKAAYDGRLDLVRSGIEQGIDVNEADPGQTLTALHMAAYNGHTETVQYLIENGAEVDCRDSAGKTPLIHACTGPFAKSVAALIEAGADVNAKDSGEGFTPLMMAAGLGQPEVVRVLLNNGADKTILDEDRESAVDHARNSGHANIVPMLE